MKNLAIVCAVLLVLPFILGYIQRGSRKGVSVTITYFRYFVFINVIFSALFVAGRMFFVGPEAAVISGWTYSPIFHLYGIAVASMALMGLFTVFKRDRIMLASAICWSYFLVLSSASHLYQVYMHQIKDVSIILVHVGYNVLVVLILLIFMSKLNRYFCAQKNEGSNESVTAGS